MKKAWPLMVIASMLLSGCSMISLCYFRNFSSNAIDLIFIGSNANHYMHRKLAYENGILDILDINDAKYKFKDSLSVEVLDSSAFRLHIPARATVELFPYFNGHPRYASTLLLTENHILIDTLFKGNYENFETKFKFRSKPRFFPTTFYYYDYISH